MLSIFQVPLFCFREVTAADLAVTVKVNGEVPKDMVVGISLKASGAALGETKEEVLVTGAIHVSRVASFLSNNV